MNLYIDESNFEKEKRFYRYNNKFKYRYYLKIFIKENDIIIDKYLLNLKYTPNELLFNYIIKYKHLNIKIIYTKLDIFQTIEQVSRNKNLKFFIKK